eukprot:5938822-Pyramimonas_sp.AAC.1
MFKIVMGGNRDTKHRDDRRGEGESRDTKHREDHHHRDRRDDRQRDRGAVLREHRAPPPPEAEASS